jgi:3-dehydroquinate dehydratase
MHFYLPKLQVPIIGVVWGERGLISWLLSRKFGSYLTHGALEAGALSAPGQSTADCRGFGAVLLVDLT